MNPKVDYKKMATIVVHGGNEAARSGDSSFVPVSPPVHHSVAYGYASMQELDEVFEGSREGYCYSRFANPTVHQFERAMAAVEGGESCIAFASGMAALHACFSLFDLCQGSAVLASRDLYGPTYISLQELCRTRGVTLKFIDITDIDLVEKSLNECSPTFLMVETISNPLVRVADLSALGRLAHAKGTALIVDNTFATPILCKPLTLGADIVVHSATKFIGGHGDVMGGVVVTDAARRQRLAEIRKMTGAVLGPQDAWLLSRSLKTLLLRVERQQKNAMEVALWLHAHPCVEKVHFPGLAHHAQHALARIQFCAAGTYGSMLSFEIKDAGKSEVFGFCERLKLCLPVTTLGEVSTLVLYPAHSSHRGLRSEERVAIGIKDNLVRMSVGIEDKDDICADLDQALNK